MRVSAITKLNKIEFNSQPIKTNEEQNVPEPRLPERLSLWQRVLNAFRDEEVISKEEEDLKAEHIDYVV